MPTRLMAFVLTLVLLFALGPAAAFATTYVVDDARILPSEVEDRIEALSERLEQATPGAEVVVITVPSLDGQDIERVAERRFEQLGIGAKDEDNGVLLLVAPNERKVRIEVGYGLEHVLRDSKAADIIDEEILPYFREDDYPAGIEAGHARIVRIVAEEYGVTVAGSSPQVGASESTSTAGGGGGAWKTWLCCIPLFLLIGIAMFVSSVRRKIAGLFGGGGKESGAARPVAPVSTGSSQQTQTLQDSRGRNPKDGFGGGNSGGGGASGSW